MNLRKIAVWYLEENGYDGLVNPEECCCCANGELFGCSNPFPGGCKEGHLVPCSGDCKLVNAPAYSYLKDQPHYHIVAGKKEMETVATRDDLAREKIKSLEAGDETE